MFPEELVEFRKGTIDPGVSDEWIWPKTDQGAWEGPLMNWLSDGNKYSQCYDTRFFQHVKHYNTVITAGANCGLYTRVYAHKFKNVYAFEPHWLNFYCLTRNCPEKHVYKFNCALSNSSGVQSLYECDNTNMGMYKLIEGESNLKVPKITIDSLNLDWCDLIQLDVEQHEAEVIEGALETIKKFKPVIIVETLYKPELITDLGYKLEVGNGDQIYFYE